MTMDSNDAMGQEIAREISHGIARRIARGIALFIAFALFIVIGGIAVQLLWNWLVPDILNLRRLTLWEALGLLALCRILFGGFGMRGGGSHRRWDGRRRHDKDWWKSPPPAAAASPRPADSR
jgi:hypothetical protein